MKALSSYMDMFLRVEDAGCNTDVQWGETEDLLQNFFLKAQVSTFHPFVLYILDFAQRKYLTVGPGKNTFLGYTTDYLRDCGPLGYYDLWHKNDWNTYDKQMFSDFSTALKDTDVHTRKNLLIRSNYRVKTKNKEYYSIAQQSSYIDVSADGLPLAVIGIVTDITPYKQDSRMAYNITAFADTNETGEKNKLLMNKYYFPDAQDGILSKREIEVLKWICEGLTTKEIAGKLSLSVYTINNHRTNILQKTNCANFAQVLKYAVTNGIV